ncbi:MAG: hypothetical protein J5966_07235 [Lachnospiraceae bacterium]|nr:hypothetical protein [Lachnospiraceae bacterium]
MYRNKYYANIITILLAAALLLLRSDISALAEEAVSGNSISENSISENEIPENEVSQNEVSQNEVSENGVSENETPAVSDNKTGKLTVSCDVISYKGRSAVVSISADCTGGGIALIQSENTGAGVKKTLYRAEKPEKGLERDSKSIDFPITANGSYAFFAYDTNGNSDSCRLHIHKLKEVSADEYIVRARENRRESTRSIDIKKAEEEEKNGSRSGTVTFGGGRGTGASHASASGRNYSVRSGSGDREEDRQSLLEKYSGWSMLKTKNRKADVRAWYEPFTDTGEPARRPQPMENIIDLSDYDVSLFNMDTPDIPDAPGDLSGLSEEPAVDEKAASGAMKLKQNTVPKKEGEHTKTPAAAVVIAIILTLAAVFIRRAKS